MTSEVHGEGELRLIRMRLDAIEHTQEVLVRADYDRIWPPLEQKFMSDDLLAEIYLLVDGHRTQRDILGILKSKGIETSEATISRKLGTLRELDLLQLVGPTVNPKVYVHLPMNRILRLRPRVERLLADRRKEQRSRDVAE